MYKLVIKTQPVSINQRYTIARNRNILSSKYRSAKEAMEWEVKSQWRGEPLTENDLCVNLFIYYSGRMNDIDAFIKIILDSMTEIVYKDDKQVSELSVIRQKADEDRVEIQVL